MPDLVTLGETCVVLVAKSASPLRYVAEFERRAGGAESTVAAGVARLGRSAGWISRLGADEFGAYVLGLMRSENVDVRQVRLVEGGQTGVFFRENRHGGNSAVFYYRANSAFASFSPDDLDADYIGSAKILHLTGITPGLSPSCRAAVEHAIDIAKAKGVQIVFDLNYRAKIWGQVEARSCLEGLMKRADHILVGREDLIKLVGVSHEDGQLDYLMGLGLATVVLKSGVAGAMLVESDGLERIPSIAIDRPVDRFGVGDSFAAGYIVGQLNGRSNRQAVDLGNKVAGWSLRLPGNMEALPSWRDLDALEEEFEVVSR